MLNSHLCERSVLSGCAPLHSHRLCTLTAQLHLWASILGAQPDWALKWGSKTEDGLRLPTPRQFKFLCKRSTQLWAERKQVHLLWIDRFFFLSHTNERTTGGQGKAIQKPYYMSNLWWPLLPAVLRERPSAFSFTLHSTGSGMKLICVSSLQVAGEAPPDTSGCSFTDRSVVGHKDGH